MSLSVLRGNALALPLADNSVDLIVTSPPYFAMRSYQDGGRHYGGQIGSEESPHAYLDALIAATREMVRVLKPSGSIWVNLGDKYCSPGGHTDRGATSRLEGRRAQRQQARADRTTVGHSVRPKSLFGLPWRYALRCIDELGLILRAEVIWSKSNGLPESVVDRVRRSHEQWFHFTVQGRYAATDVIREPAVTADVDRRSHPEVYAASLGRSYHDHATDGVRGNRTDAKTFNPLGKLPGSVWAIPTQPLVTPSELGLDHFAAFPLEWPRRIILGWSPSGICTACGEGRRPVRTTSMPGDNNAMSARRVSSLRIKGDDFRRARAENPITITGYACGCPEPTTPTRPAVVLDPFGGTGTVALAADVLGRNGITVDMSGDYCRLAAWRTQDRGERARALQVERPPEVPEGQGTLWEAPA